MWRILNEDKRKWIAWTDWLIEYYTDNRSNENTKEEQIFEKNKEIVMVWDVYIYI